ncbi:MAG: fluoride efflux transporter CrcB [Acidobacteriaceae bacterium]
MSKYMYIAVGGALGSIARFWVGSEVASRVGTKFPFGTFIINITACLFIGFSLAFLAKRTNLNPAWRFLIPIGFLGGYSTFSSYEWETVSILRNGEFSMAALYAFGSLFLGIAAVFGGILLAELIS